MATNVVFRASQSDLLRNTLRANSVFCATTGIVSLVAATPLAAWLGLSSPFILVGLGLMLLPYAGWLFYQTTQKTIDRRVALAAIFLDVLWVIDSIAILLIGWPPLTVSGMWIVAILALIVAGFAEAQYIGLRRMPRQNAE